VLIVVTTLNQYHILNMQTLYLPVCFNGVKEMNDVHAFC
jgi:hypothetical protein